jgi:hypothetical protein
VELTGWQASDTTGGVAIHFEDARDSAFYFAAAAPARRRPRLDRVTLKDIRHGGADYLVICSDALEGDAMRLASHRSSVAPPFTGASAAVVRMSDILAWYAGGRMDPVAIRNFLHDAVKGGGWQPAPSYVCFLGDASFDYKDILKIGEPKLNETQVPTFQHNYYARQYPSDDWLVDLDSEQGVGGAVPDLIVGRLPAANAAEASALVDKVIGYDVNPSYGPWRNRMLTLVDDTKQGNQSDPLGTTHIEQADSLERGHAPSWLDRGKVELIEYPFTSGTSKDGARQELLRRLDEGAVFWHFIGHGNPFKLADENAFLLNDVAAMSNGPRLPFFIASSCDVGPFDLPNFTMLGEALVKKPSGGTIASYAGTVETFAFANFELGMSLYDATLYPPELGGARTIGEASYVAKHRDFVTQNDRPYHLLGDPATRLAMPREDVRLHLFDDVTGEAFEDSLPRGRRIRVEGEVHGTRDPAVSDLKAISGSVRILVDDAPVRRTVADVYGSVAYDANPRTAYVFDIPVAQGRFTARFTVPMEATMGERARVSAYLSGTTTDGSGAAVVRMVDGVPSAQDSTGPTLRFADRLVGPGDVLTIELEDESGIKTLGGSPLDPIDVSMDGGEPVNLAPDFRYDAGSSTRGSVRVPLPGLEDGTHTLVVGASDNLADGSNRDRHRTQRAFEFRVAGVIASVEPRSWVLPNPFVRASGTDLVFSGFAGASTTLVLVYDVRGRILRRLREATDSGHAQVHWDGKDDGGKPVAAGVYLYRATVVSAGASERRFTGRLALLR